jgi:hypothetical protein
MSPTPTPIKQPGFFYVYWCMLLVAYIDTFKYVLAIRSSNENDDKNFGLLVLCILEVAKMVGSTIKIVACLTISLILTTVWPAALPFITLVTAGMVYHRVRKNEKESEANTEKLRQELSGS